MFFAGPTLLPDGIKQMWFQVEQGRIRRQGIGDTPEPAEATGWIVPFAVNAHTHLGDTFLYDVPGKPSDLHALVGPGGWKHQKLQAADAKLQASAIHARTREMADTGTIAALDFREGGVKGVQFANALETDIGVTWFGRPAKNTFDEDQAYALSQLTNAIGLSAVRDFGNRRDVVRWAEFAEDNGLRFALHASEGVREDMEFILSLNPHFLVHCCKANQRDLEAISEQKVPVVICPRSNEKFGIKANAAAMLDAGIVVALGTDNGMLQDGNLWHEASHLVASQRIEVETAIRMATYHGHHVAGQPVAAPAVGDKWDRIVIDPAMIAPTRSKPGLRLNPEFQ